MYTRSFDKNIWSSFIYSFFCARPFDQKLGSSLIYFFYVHTIIRLKYMVLFHLFFLLCMTIWPRLVSSLIYFFYLHTTIQQKYMFLFYLLFLFCTTIRPKIRSHIDLHLLFAHEHSVRIYGPLSCNLPFVNDHSTKN